MPKLDRKAGQNIRDLAVKRRIKALTSFTSAGLVIFLPFFLSKASERFLKQISSLNPSQPPQAFQLPIALYIFSIVIAMGLVMNGTYLWKRANHADQGARGEEDIAQAIAQLTQEGWQIEYGMRLGNKLGDADIVCISPQNKAYVIDVKSHRGEVITDGQQLYRRVGNSKYSFEKNFLNQAKKQALQVKKQKELNFVTPIVAFSDAKVAIASEKLQKVYVVEKSALVLLLRSLG
ncbi:MAG: NERD domain-containing protein [Drouetiella hepatica Uher 2000/2452]|jgi:hypothetical protein|uniref:NERD domain-containing protein n=1 Tax=Drouetiella hepatica Uher 2000/2452 TaxID=904376 RepID=A0A951Q9A1_9CYAN|nr:NERD domain-containing protein [Drouetiella hepatica Uher 2000/2452]